MGTTQLRTWLVKGIKYNWTIVKIYTGEDLSGIGEATNWPGSLMMGFTACKFDSFVHTSYLPVTDGYFHLNDTPGLGFDLKEAELEKHPGVRTPRTGFYI